MSAMGKCQVSLVGGPGSYFELMPKRIRLQRTRGWRKPTDAVVVARPTRWGNPYRIGIDGDRLQCVEKFREALTEGRLGFTVMDVRRELAGRDLACWCPEDGPCHANVLIEYASSP
jgi:hypothetical protein